MKPRKLITRQERARRLGLTRTMIELPTACLTKLDVLSAGRDMSRSALIRRVLAEFANGRTSSEVADGRTDLFD